MKVNFNTNQPNINTLAPQQYTPQNNISFGRTLKVTHKNFNKVSPKIIDLFVKYRLASKSFFSALKEAGFSGLKLGIKGTGKRPIPAPLKPLFTPTK